MYWVPTKCIAKKEAVANIAEQEQEQTSHLPQCQAQAPAFTELRTK